jgi:hypothetical protein
MRIKTSMVLVPAAWRNAMVASTLATPAPVAPVKVSCGKNVVVLVFGALA